MKHLILGAILALGVATQGVAHADFAPVFVAQNEIPSTESILKAAAAASEYSYDCLCEMYAAGLLDIEKGDDGTYSVKISDGGTGGGLAIILVDDHL